ncbi:hypothetical protein ACQGS6_26790 [Bacillus sp. GMs2/2]|uniref:hypothetical protein n=1 Tax=Bacillus sp. GMs2/2 TaxID=3418494 RepID=UPI003CF40B0D
MTESLSNMGGFLVSSLGLEKSTAMAIAEVIVTGGVTAAVVAWPFLAPFVATINGIAAVGGIGLLTGF